jgi:hypothetical protein
VEAPMQHSELKVEIDDNQIVVTLPGTALQVS